MERARTTRLTRLSRFHVIAAATAVAFLLPAGAARAGDMENLLALDLPVIAGTVPVYYSPSAAAEAKVYAETFNRAVPWLRQRLDWQGEIAMAVLDADGYTTVSGTIPYPVPYADTAGSSRLVVMPDRIDTFPGFDRWDIDPITLNAALTLHEIGHIVAAQTGIASENHWINELIADVFLAGYARAEKPAFTALLDGVPPRFADAGVLTYLHELDLLYSGVGLENYAWFQFRLADIADYIVTGRDFATVVAELRGAFPAGDAQLESVDVTFAKLEKIAPGVSALAEDMTEPTALPSPPAGPCTIPPKLGEGSPLVFIENSSNAPLRYITHTGAMLIVGIELMTGETAEGDEEIRAAEILKDFDFGTTLDPGETRVERAEPGEVYLLEGGGCFVIPTETTRFVWTGQPN